MTIEEMRLAHEAVTQSLIASAPSERSMSTEHVSCVFTRKDICHANGILSRDKSVSLRDACSAVAARILARQHGINAVSKALMTTDFFRKRQHEPKRRIKTSAEIIYLRAR